MDYSVYSPVGKHVATCLHVEEAAVLMSFLGEGATIRLSYSGKIVWTEGEDGEAFESGDDVVEVVHKRQFK